jgi:hypothetical protein
MEITCTPDLGVVLPPDDMPYTTLCERAAAACKTIHMLAENGLPGQTLEEQPEDAKVVEDIVTSFAQDEEKTNQMVTTARFSALRPAVILQIDEHLTEFNHIVVRNAVQIRTFVTNKLILESSNPDARVRIRALELLGKISDVGLFTERSEVTVNNRSTDDLKLSLREKLELLRSRNRADVVDVQDVQKLDTPEPEFTHTVPETTLNGSLLDVVDAEFGDLGVQTPVEVAPGVENSPEAQ